MKDKTQIATSIRQRLRNLASERGQDFQQLLVSYALERVLYRLAQSRHRERFVLKGALLFRLWFDLTQRPTRDADFLGFGSAEPEEFAAIFREIAEMEIAEDDGLVFDAKAVRVEDIRKAAGYPEDARLSALGGCTRQLDSAFERQPSRRTNSLCDRPNQARRQCGSW